MGSRFRRRTRLFELDCRLGFLQALPVFVVLALMTLAMLMLAYLEEASMGDNVSNFSFGDNVALLLAGQPPYEFRPGVLFIPPLGWLFLFLLLLYSVLIYPLRDLAHFGDTCIVLGGSRRSWWASKALWVALVVFTGWIVMMGAVAVWTAAQGQTFSLDVHEQAMYYSQITSDTIATSSVSAVPFICAGLFATLALAELQLVCSFLASSAVGFVITAGLLVLSSYAQVPALIGNLLMFARYEGANIGGVSMGASLCWALAILVISIAIGFLRCSHWDLLPKERHV